jgi:tetratricopeptide (TPR) repeat protein
MVADGMQRPARPVVPALGPRDALVAVAVFVLSCSLYAGAVGHGFVHDDEPLILNNPLIRALDNTPALLASDYWEPRSSGLYRPLTTLSFALNFALGELDPRGYHLANIALHGCVGALVWLVSRLVFADAAVAAGAALLFAAHAVHTEPVAGVGAGRAELLCAVFFLLSLLCHALRSRTAVRRSGALYALGLGAFFLALLSKESAVALLGVVFLHDLAFGPHARRGLLQGAAQVLRTGFRRVYAGHLLVAALALAVRLAALGGGRVLPAIPFDDNPLAELALPWRLTNALQVALRYAALLAFPRRLSYDYSYDQIPLLDSLGDPAALAALLLSGCVAWLALRSYRASHALFFALGFTLLTFSLVSNLVMPIGTILGERLLYLPSLGFCWLFALAARRLAQRLPRAPRAQVVLYVGVVALAVGLHGWRSLERIPVWRSPESLFLRDVETSPNSAKAQLNAGIVLERAGRHAEAIARYERAIRIMGPRPTMAYNNLGYLLVDREIDVPRGIRLLEKIRGFSPGHAEILDSLGWGYHKAGRQREARRLVRRSLAVEPSGPSAELRREHLRLIEEALAESATVQRPEGSGAP